MANPLGLLTGIDRIAQADNAYVVANWPANPAQDNVVSYEVLAWKTSGDDGGTASAVTVTTLTDNTKSWGNLSGSWVTMGGAYAQITSSTATALTFSAWTDLNGNGVATPALGTYSIFRMQAVKTGGLQYRFDALPTNTSFSFVVRAQNNVGSYSPYSAPRSITTAQDTVAPAAPTGLVAYKSPRGALLYWNGNTEADLAGYQLEWAPPLASQLASGVAITSIPLAAPLTRSVAAGSTVTVDSENFTVATGGAAAGATAIPVNSQAPGVTHSANAPVYCGQLVLPAASLATSAAFFAPSGTALGTTLNFRLRAVDWSGNVSAWTAANAAATTDGVVIDELLVGNLKVAMQLTSGSVQTASSGARTVMDSTSFRAYDGSATNWGAPSGAGVTFEANAAGNIFLKGTVASSIVQSGVFLGSGTPPTYTIPSTGFAIDPTNGFRWWNAGTLQAQWAANGGLTIYSGASIYGATIASEQNAGTVNSVADNYVLNGSVGLTFYPKGGTTPMSQVTKGGDFMIGWYSQIIGGSSRTVAGSYGWTSDGTTFLASMGINLSQGWYSFILSGPSSFYARLPSIQMATGTAGMGASNLPVQLASTEISGADVSGITFSNIPQGFRHLLVVWRAQENNAGADAMYVRVNNDAGGNYYYELLDVTGTTASPYWSGATTSMRVGALPGQNSTTGVSGNFGGGYFYVNDYSRSDRKKLIYGSGWRDDANGSGIETVAGSYIVATTAVTSLTFFAQGTVGQFRAGTNITLYGLP